MDFEHLFAVTASALTAQKERLRIISGNLAHAETTRTPDGGPYRRRDIVFTAVPIKSSFEEGLSLQLKDVPKGVVISKIIMDPRPFRRVHEPSHPDADEHGYILYPNINVMEEMVNMMSALRAYEANVTVMDVTKTMLNKTLEIGR